MIVHPAAAGLTGGTTTKEAPPEVDEICEKVWIH